MISSLTKIRVRYADTDQMRFVYYSKYLEYFEQGRADLLRDVGFPYSEVEKMGYFLPVTEAYVRYRRAARYDEILDVKTILKELPAVKIRIEYEVMRPEDSEIIVEGHTVHSFIRADTGKPMRAPGLFIDAISSAMKKSSRGHHTSQET